MCFSTGLNFLAWMTFLFLSSKVFFLSILISDLLGFLSLQVGLFRKSGL